MMARDQATTARSRRMAKCMMVGGAGSELSAVGGGAVERFFSCSVSDVVRLPGLYET